MTYQDWEDLWVLACSFLLAAEWLYLEFCGAEFARPL